MAKKLPVEQEVHIEALSEDGLGAATFNERPLWVRNALPGERVQARILKRRGGQRPHRCGHGCARPCGQQHDAPSCVGTLFCVLSTSTWTRGHFCW